MSRRSRSIKSRSVSRKAVQKMVETLEPRTLLSVSMNSVGETVVTPENGSRVIYCSSSTGSDSNNGLSPSSPVSSLTKAESLLRNHTGDQMLLKAGDTWHGNFVFWNLSGKSAQEPMVLGSYGSGARPTVLTGSKTGFETGDIRVPEVDYVDIIGIHFNCDARDPALTSTPVRDDPVGIEILTKSNDILVENCFVEHYAVNMNFQHLLGTLTNVTVRRNVITDSWSSDAHSQGIYVTGVNNFTLDGNFFDHNGWNTQISGAGQTWFNHDCYISYNNTGCVVTNNIFARASGYGLQARLGGIVSGNVFIDDPIAMSFGIVTGATSTAGGVTGSITNNVFIGGANINGTSEGGGIIIGNIKPGAGAVISGNIFTQSIAGASAAIELTAGQSQVNPQQSVGINDLKIQNNILYRWTLGIDVSGGQIPGGSGLHAFNRVAITGNKFENLSGYSFENHDPIYNSQETISGNSYYNANQWRQGGTLVKAVGSNLSSPMPFADPNRSIATYAAAMSMGGGDTGFLAKAKTQSEQAWNPIYDAKALMAYFDVGFSITPGSTPPPVVIPPVTPPPIPRTRNAGTSILAMDYDQSHGSVQSDNFSGLGYLDGGDWVEYNQVDFGNGVSKFTAGLAAVARHYGTIQLRLDSPTGALIGTITPKVTGSWSNYTQQSTTVTGASGVHNLYLIFTGAKGVANVKSFQFS